MESCHPAAGPFHSVRLCFGIQLHFEVTEYFSVVRLQRNVAFTFAGSLTSIVPFSVLNDIGFEGSTFFNRQ